MPSGTGYYDDIDRLIGCVLSVTCSSEGLRWSKTSAQVLANGWFKKLGQTIHFAAH